MKDFNHTPPMLRYMGALSMLHLMFKLKIINLEQASSTLGAMGARLT